MPTPTNKPPHTQPKHTTPSTPQHNNTTTQQHHNVTAATAAGKRPDPSRTRKLSPPAPMVLHRKQCGRVGHRRTTTTPGPPTKGGPGVTARVGVTARLSFP